MNIKNTFKLAGLVVAVAAIALVSACSESYPSMAYDYSQNEGALKNQDELSNRTPVMLFVNPQNFFTITASSRQTRSAATGSGPFVKEDSVQYYNSIFYVFAFRKTTNEQGPALTSPTDFTQTAYAEINKIPGLVNDSVDHADCLLDGKDYLAGLTTQLTPQLTPDGTYSYKLNIVDNIGTVKDTLVLDNNERKFFYSTKYEDVPYDFFGYYFDNFKYTPSNTHRDADKIWYSDVTIDGTQDILFGKAPDLNSGNILQTDYADQWKKLTIDEQRKIHWIGGYSTFTAHRGIHPNIGLEHQLARLQFEIVPGDSSASDVIIDSIIIREKYKADFVVAGRNQTNLGLFFHSGTPADTADIKFQFEDNDKLDTLRLSDGSYYLEDGNYVLGYKTVPYDGGKTTQKRRQIGHEKYGKSVMLPVGTDRYEMHLYWHQRVRVQKIDGSTVSFSEDVISRHSKYSVKAPNDINNNPTNYQKGYYYNVVVKVYGIQEIQITTSVYGWQNGEDRWIDPDETFDVK